MKRFLLSIALAAASAVVLATLPACTTVPAANQVQAIQNACAVDAGIRPTVTVLLAVPGLAKPEQIAAVAAARAVIDPICANPIGTPQANAAAALAGATGQILAIVTDLQAKRAAEAK